MKLKFLKINKMKNATKNSENNNNKNSIIIKNKNTNFELLENTYKLDHDSEIIARKIIDLLIKKTIGKSRLNDLEKFKNTYTINKVLQLATLFGHLGSLKPDIDSDGILAETHNLEENLLIEEISPPKIDSLAGNKTKLIKATEKDFLNIYILNNETIKHEVDMFKPIIDKDKEREMKFIEKELKKQKNNKKLQNKNSLHRGKLNQKSKNLESFNDKLLKELKAQLLPRSSLGSLNSKNKTLFSEVFNNLSNRTIDNNLANFNNLNTINKNIFNQTKMQNSLENEKINVNITNNSLNKTSSGLQNKISTLITNKFSIGHRFDLTEDFFEQFPLEIINDLEEIKEENEDVLQRENNLRIYFKEKEAERSKKHMEEKKAEKTLKEEAKKRKELLDAMAKRPFSFDAEGKIVIVNSPDQESLIGLTKVNSKVKKDINYDEKCDLKYDAHLYENQLIFETEDYDKPKEEINLMVKKFGNLNKQGRNLNQKTVGNKDNVNQKQNQNNFNNNTKENQDNNDNINSPLGLNKTENKKAHDLNFATYGESNNNLQAKSNSNKIDKLSSKNGNLVTASENKNNLNKNVNLIKLENQSVSGKTMYLKARNLKENAQSKYNNNILDEIKDDKTMHSKITQEQSNKENTDEKNDLNQNTKKEKKTAETEIVKKTNIERVTKTNEPHTDRERLQPEENIEQNKEEKDEECSENEDSQHNETLNTSNSSIDTQEAEKRKRIKYYQPNPLRTHEIPPGVTMEIYGNKKEGGLFPSIPNKLTFKEFNDLLSIYKPELIKKKHTHSVNELYKIYETHIMSDSKIEVSNLKNSRILKNQYTQINSKIEEDLILKCADLKEQLFVFEEELKNKRNSNNDLKLKTENPLKLISKSPKMISNKESISDKDHEIKLKNKKTNLVKVFKEFKYHAIDEINDENIYDFQKLKNGNNQNCDLSKENEEFLFKHGKEIITKNQLVSPVNKHVPFEKELGPMKKYPRERLPKEILAISGKIPIESIAGNTNKNFYGNNNMRKSMISGSQFGTSGMNFFGNRNSVHGNNKNEEGNRKSFVTSSNFNKNDKNK